MTTDYQTLQSRSRQPVTPPGFSSTSHLRGVRASEHLEARGSRRGSSSVPGQKEPILESHRLCVLKQQIYVCSPYRHDWPPLEETKATERPSRPGVTQPHSICTQSMHVSPRTGSHELMMRMQLAGWERRCMDSTYRQKAEVCRWQNAGGLGTRLLVLCAGVERRRPSCRLGI